MRLFKIALLPPSSDTHPGRWISYEDVEHTLLCVCVVVYWLWWAFTIRKRLSQANQNRLDLCKNGSMKEWNTASLLHVIILQNWFKWVTSSLIKGNWPQHLSKFLTQPNWPAQPSGNCPVDFPLETRLNLSCVLKKKEDKMLKQHRSCNPLNLPRGDWISTYSIVEQLYSPVKAYSSQCV